ncbi:MAG: CCA tRNA nucleotidyltransferase [Pseudomonadota bacterium]
MSDYKVKELDSETKNIVQSHKITALIKILAEHNIIARYVGGFVRDILAHVKPEDIDIAVDCKPDELIRALKQHRIQAVPSGIKYGSVKVIYEHITCEVTSLRKDITSDGRFPIIEYTKSWKEDSCRRDFTINAIYLDIEGNLYDYHDGLNDLKNGIVRFIGNAARRVEEDTLRILRYFRFLSKYGDLNNLDADALQACRIYSIRLVNLSGERIQYEILKLLKEKDFVDALGIMAKNEVLGNINLQISDFKLIKAMCQIQNENIDVKFDNMSKIALLIKSSEHNHKDVTIKIVNDWRLLTRDANVLLNYVSPKVAVDISSDTAQHKSFIRSFGKKIFINMMLINWAENLSNGKAEAYDERYTGIINFANEWDIPKFPVSGYDIMMLKTNNPHGKIIGSLLRQAESWWEQNDYEPNRKMILDYLSDISVSSVDAA